MATATAEKSSIQVELPKTEVSSQVPSVSEVDKSVILSLSRNNELFVTSSYIGVIDKKIEKKELSGLLTLLKNDSKSTDILIRADADTRYQYLVDVITEVKKNNFFTVKLVTDLDKDNA